MDDDSGETLQGQSSDLAVGRTSADAFEQVRDQPGEAARILDDSLELRGVGDHAQGALFAQPPQDLRSVEEVTSRG